MAWTNGDTLNTPYKAGLTQATEGLSVRCVTGTSNYDSQLFFVNAGTEIFRRSKGNGTWSSWYLIAMANKLYGSEIPMSTTDSTKLKAAIEDRIMVNTSFTGDIDTLTKPGTYYLQNASCTTENKTGMYGTLTVLANSISSGSRVTQLWVEIFGNNDLWHRRKANDTSWELFKKMLPATNNIVPYYGICSTAASTRQKDVTISDFPSELVAGQKVVIKFANAQTYNGCPRLKINSLSWKDIYKDGATAAVRYEWQAGQVVEFVYDGTNWVIVDGSTATTSYYGKVRLSSSTTGTSEIVAATEKAVKTLNDNKVEKSDSTILAMDLGDKTKGTDYTVSLPSGFSFSSIIIRSISYRYNNETIYPYMQARLDSDLGINCVIKSDGKIHYGYTGTYGNNGRIFIEIAKT
jgi:hypothetical protein